MEGGGGPVFGHRGFSCLMGRRNILRQPGNLNAAGLVYTCKTTRGVGG
jgi:hypothetical protein